MYVHHKYSRTCPGAEAMRPGDVFPDDNRRSTMALSDNKETVQTMRSISHIKESNRAKGKVSIKPLN